MTIAIAAENNIFGRKSNNTKGDAFRHAFWLSINERDCGTSVFTGESIAKKFSDAHESGTPSGLIKSMDLFNNAVGINIGHGRSKWWNGGDITLASEVVDALNAGSLRYISNLDVNDNLTNNSALIPTNQ